MICAYNTRSSPLRCIFRRQHQNRGRNLASVASLVVCCSDLVYHRNHLLDQRSQSKNLSSLLHRIPRCFGHIEYCRLSFVHGHPISRLLQRYLDQLHVIYVSHKKSDSRAASHVQPSWPLCFEVGSVCVLMDSYLPHSCQRVLSIEG